MPIESFSAKTLDDLLHDVYSALGACGSPVGTSRGDTIELTAVVLELTDPRARLSRSEARGRIFSCLGELCWYLAGDDSLGMIQHYLSAYDKEAVGGRVLGAYGPRLFGSEPGQVTTILQLLRKRPQSRRAVLQIFGADDLRRAEGDVPCTCTLQFLVRGDALDAVVYMRSNDAVKGLTHDVFCFTMLHELIARSLELELGRYTHMVGSLHVYTSDLPTTERFLAEGFQSTKSPMPPMPDGDPWPAVRHLLRIEDAIRTGNPIPDDSWASLPQYWENIALLLEAYSADRSGHVNRVEAIQAQLADTVYNPFLTDLSSRRTARRTFRPGQVSTPDDLSGSL